MGTILMKLLVIDDEKDILILIKRALSSDYEVTTVHRPFEEIPENRAKKLVNKPMAGHFGKAGVKPMRTLREFRLDDSENYEVGQVVKADVFAEGETVDITGTTKGRGFTGAIYRWNQHTGPMAHGSKYHRGVGSMSANSDPSRVFKNKHMPGHYGVERVTIQHLEIVKVDAERSLLLVHGAVPGPNKGLLLIRDSVKA